MKHELLSPAGSPEIFRAVIAAGADAVYLGGDQFGARAYARNFTRQEILEALDYAHLHGRKIYLTVNTLLKNREIGRELYDYLEPLYRSGLDAIIVQDYGVFQFARKYFPDLPVHISTQASVANTYGAAFFKKMGASRIVTARELSLDEIRNIHAETGIEIESFIHGALCYCYSGQCLMSSMLGGRSGNRGRCAQPCRLAYQVTDEAGNVLRENENYPLSPKDLCTLALLPKLCEAGVYSFKIEGRMKQLAYAAGVTGIYRRYLDLYEQDPENYRVKQEDLDALAALGNRSGFTDGYYERRNGREMMTLTNSSHSSALPEKQNASVSIQKIPVSGKAIFRKGEPSCLELSCALPAAGKKGSGAGRIFCTTVYGACPCEAKSRPITGDELQARLKKTGDTPFAFTDLCVETDADLFLPVKAINELRREGFHRLTGQILKEYSRESPATRISCSTEDDAVGEEKGKKKQRLSAGKPFLNVTISSAGMLPEVLASPYADMISLDMPYGEEAVFCAERIREAGKKTGFFLPYVLRRNSSDMLAKKGKHIAEQFDRVFARSYDGLDFAGSVLKVPADRIMPDANLYVFSAEAARAFGDAGCESYTVSPELNAKELTHMPNRNGEFLLYGFLPLMISAQCVYRNYRGCRLEQNDPAKDLFLTDRYFKKFFIKSNCQDCYNIIYNSRPLYLFHLSRDVQELGFGSCRISFVNESAERIREILNIYGRAFVKGEEIPAPAGKDSFTAGHFRRGVE